jgi:hypothetical protein
MGPESKLLNDLFMQQRELNAEQFRISQGLVEVNQKIQYLLALHANRVSDVGPALAIAVPIGNGRTLKNLRKNGARRSWFDRGEAVKLIRRVARRSMRPAQVVHAVMDAKGYATSLTGDEKKRAEAALHQAVILAVKAGALTRDQEGAVRVKA